MVYKDACIITTSRCNLACPDCLLKQSIPERLRGPDLTIDALKVFVRQCIKQGQLFRSVAFTGGEPTEWKPLREAITFTQQSGIAKRVVVISNGYRAKPEDYGTADYVVLSHYGPANLQRLMRLKKLMGKRARIQNVEHLPLNFGSDANKKLPVDCGACQMILHKWHVYPCAASWRLLHNGIHINDAEFVRKLSEYQVTEMNLCQKCFNNRNIKRMLRPGPTIEVRVLGTFIGWRWQLLSNKERWRRLYRKLIDRT